MFRDSLFSFNQFPIASNSLFRVLSVIVQELLSVAQKMASSAYDDDDDEKELISPMGKVSYKKRQGDPSKTIICRFCNYVPSKVAQ